MLRTLVIDMHPNENSFCFSLAKAYYDEVRNISTNVRRLRIADLQFSPNLRYGYQKRTDLEPDLLYAIEMIKWAQHIVWIHPVWWYGLPAISKGFIDRVFLPSIAFEVERNSNETKGLFTNKTAMILSTLDHTEDYYKEICLAPSEHQLTLSLQLCGIKVTGIKYIGPIANSTQIQRKDWLNEVISIAKNNN